MKQALFFIGIMLLFGSLKRDDSRDCPDKITLKYYKKGKLVTTTSRTQLVEMNNIDQRIHDIKTGKKFLADSLTITITK